MIQNRFFKFTSMTIAFLGVIQGCGASDEAHQNIEAAARQYLTAYCGKIQQCLPDVFGAAFPNGLSECIDKGVAGIPAENKGKNSACTNAEIDSCSNATKAISCDGVTQLSDIKQPPQCAKC